MLKTSGLLLILLTLFSIQGYAQRDITGKVIGKSTNLPIQNANISVYDQSNIIFHTISDTSGNFNIPLVLVDKINRIKFTAFNFDELLIRDIPKKFSDKNLFIGVFKLVPHVTELNEVKVIASKRYRDTTKIDLANQKFERSVMIDDIFATPAVARVFASDHYL